MTVIVRADHVAAVRGSHAWLVWRGDRLLGAVAGGGSSWFSGRVGPLRSRPWIDTRPHATRREAIERLEA